MEEDLVIPVDEPTTEADPTKLLEFQVNELKGIVESYAKREKLLQKQYTDYVIKTHDMIVFINSCITNCMQSIKLAIKNMENNDND